MNPIEFEDPDDHIHINIQNVLELQVVKLGFSKKIDWIGFSPKLARQIAISLLQGAEQIEDAMNAPKNG